MLVFKKVDEVIFFITVDDVADDGLLQQFYMQFRLEHPNKFFMPSYKNGQWDGIIKFVKYFNSNMDTLIAPIGLMHLYYKYMVYNDIEFRIVDDEFGSLDIDLSNFDTWLDKFESKREKKISKRDYQYNATREALRRSRGVLESPTGSGKSLIIYTYISWILQHDFSEGEKILLVVPNVSLVEQMANDFSEYGFNIDYITRIYSGQVKNFNNPIIISTWQSLYKNDIEFFEQFSGLIIDECHKAKSKKMLYISENCVNARWRLATTGTIQKDKFTKTTIMSNFGDVFNTTSTKKLIDSGFLCDFYIRNIIIKWKKKRTSEKKSFAVDNFHSEYKLVIESIERIIMVEKMIIDIWNKRTTRKSTLLVLSNRVQYIEDIYSDIVEKKGIDENEIFYIHGKIKPKIRSQILEYVSKNGGVIIANIDILGTGINIPNVDTVLFATTQKSEILTLQSIGRSIRLSKGKKYATIIDLTDKIPTGRGPNTIYTWLDYKKDIYSQQGFKYDDIEIELNVEI